MRVPLLILAAMAAAGPAAAASRDYPARDFEAVELQSAASVTITAGPRFAVHAEGNPELLRRLTAEVRRNTLVLGWANGNEQQEHNDLHVMITMPRVAGASISGAGSIAIDHADAPQFAGSVGGAGTIRIAQLNAPHTSFSMGGTGEIVAAGHTAQLAASVSGVGTIDAMNLAAAAGNFDMSGTGHIRARVNGPATVNLSGMGNVVVAGNPRCTVHKDGLGSVTCGR